MMLTIEDVIKQEKLLAGFVPFVEIAIQVKQLTFYHQIAFFCSCYERILPIYMLVDGNDGWGDISILRLVQDDLWNIAGGNNIQEEMTAYCIDKTNKIFIKNNANDGEENRQGLYTYFGEETHNIARLILEYVDLNAINTYFKIFTKVAYVLYEYLDMYFANVNPIWEFKTTPDEQDAIVMNNSLMQAELQKELADLELLKNTPKLTPEILSTFRANACPNGVGILGSLDTVRANLEGIQS